MSKRWLQLKEGSFVILVLVGALAFFYRDVVFGGHTFLVEGSVYGTMPLVADGTMGPYGYTGPLNRYEPDLVSKSGTAEPDNRFLTLSYQSGQIPLWNPHEGLGTPFYATGQVGVFDPIRALIANLIPSQWWPVAIDLTLLLRYLLGGFCTYLFLRSLGAALFPALAAGVAFMFAAYWLITGDMPHVAVELFFPLTMLAYHRLAVKRTTGTLAFCAFAVFILIVSDFPELYPLQLGFAVLWYTFLTILLMRNTPDKRRFAVRMALRFAVATGLGLMLGAFVLLPFAQFLLDASTLHDATHMIRQGYTNIAGYFVITPSEFGRISIGALALTTIGWIIGFATPLDERQRKLFIYSLAFMATAILAIPVSYNVPGFRLLLRLPFLNMISMFKYIQPIVAFLVACSAGIGLELFLSTLPRLRLQKIIFYGLGGLLLAGLAAGIVLLSRSVDFVRVRAGASLVFDSAVLLALLLGVALRKVARSPVTGMVFVVLLVLEPALLNSFFEDRPLRYNPFTVPPFVAYLKEQPQPFRIAADRYILYPNQSTAYQIDDYRYQNALDARRYVAYCKQFLVNAADLEDPVNCVNAFTQPRTYGRALDLLNVEYILTSSPMPPARDDPGAPFELVFNSDGVYVYRNPNAFPRAFIVTQAEVAPTLMAALERLGAKDFDPSQTVLLEETPPKALTSPAVEPNAPLQPAQVVSRTDNDMTIQTTLTAPGFLVVSELYYSGWEAVVDGKPAHLYSADGTLRAVALETGAHTVEFHFRPTVLFVGLLLALLALLSIVVALIWERVAL